MAELSLPFSIESSKVVILTGAGISAESGIKTFRDNDGLWENHKVEDVATPNAWNQNPELVWKFYQQRRKQLLEVHPNPAHNALVNLSSVSKEFVLITQNVDDLHERSGSKNVIHMHGELRRLKCEKTRISQDRMSKKDLQSEFIYCNCCSIPKKMRPDIVWFGEEPYQLNKIFENIEDCDLFVVIGSSGHVYPAAGLVNLASKFGAYTINFNLEPPINSHAFDEIIIGPAGITLDKWVNTIIKNYENSEL